MSDTTTILIVEDEAIVAADLSGKLRRLGYEIAGTAAGGEEAVALACSLRPQLILMDIRLEGSMDGIEAAEAIQSRHDVPVIYLTAHSDAATLSRAKLTGPFGYILKPFEERELATQIELALYKYQVDRQLRDQREWLRVTLTSIGDAVIATDAGGRITFINPVAESLTGWKAEEASGRPFPSVFRIVNEQTGEALKEPVGSVLREGRPVALANHAALVTRDGRIVPIEDSASPILDAGGKVIGAVLVFHDVTEKRRAEEALRESEEKFRSAFANAAIGFAMTTPEGRFVDVNPAYCALTGYCIEELRALGAPRLIHPDDFAENMMLIDRMLAGRIADFVVENRYFHKNGGAVWVRKSVSLVHNAEGAPQWIIALVEDITGRKRIEEDLRRSRDELELRVYERTAELRERAEQLTRLSSQLTLAEQRERRRLAVIIHDHLQQLLVGAKIRLEILSNELGSDHRQSLEQIYNLLMESLKTARSLNTQMAPHILYERGLGPGLEWLAETMQETYHIRIETDIDPGAIVEPEDLKVLLFESARELLFNVVKHAGSSSARVNMTQIEAGNLRITVSDHGVGFDSETLMRNLGRDDRFGLFSIRERLELIGGRLEVESSPGNGAAFNLIVPTDQTPAVEEPFGTRGVSSDEAFTAVPSEQRIGVLLVDDHVVMREGLLSLLEGHTDIKVVGEAANGEEAVQMARKLQPEVILMDISMPKMDGMEATKLIHSALPRIRIIGLSMYDDAETQKAMLNAGAVAFMPKSGHSEALLNAIREQHFTTKRKD